MTRLTLVLTLAAILACLSLVVAQRVIPDKIGFTADTVRSYLPDDGELIEQGRSGKEYIGLALGHEVTASGQMVAVGPKLDSKGVAFGDGYLAINVGAHIEVEQVGATLAFNATARVYLRVEDEFNVVLTVDEDRLKVVGDNEGGKLAVAVGKEKIKDMLRRELSKLGDQLTKKIREQKIPAELKYVVIHRDGIDVMKTKPAPKSADDFVVSAELHFHTTTDNKEGGTLTAEFFSDEKNIFAAVPTLKEEDFGERTRKEVEHKFEKPIPLPDKIAFARVSLTEAKEINIGWNFEATFVLKTANGKEIVFEGTKLRLDTTGMRRPGTARLTIPRVR